MAVEAKPLFGRYTGTELIGVGRLGAVYRATDALLGRLVAVKLLDNRFSENVRRRFIRETLAAARLSTNPHTVTVYDVGERDGQAYVVMEYLSGGSLEGRLRQEGAQPPSRVLTWLEQAGTALDAAHEEGIVHGNVKPANLLLDAHESIRVADFAFAATAEHANGNAWSAAGDRYALAVVGFELLSGRLPFAADATAQSKRPTPSVSAADPSLPGELDAVFATALAQDPAQRFSSCAELTAALRAAFSRAAAPTLIARVPSNEPTTAIAPPARYPAAVARRNRIRTLWPIAGLIALAALAAGIAGALLGGGSTGAHQARRTSSTAGGHIARQGRATVAKGRTGSTAGTAGTTAAAPTADPHVLNDDGFALMQRGEFQAALPLLRQAVRGLEGQTRDPYDGYANFNLGLDLIKLGRCAEALPYLNRAKQIEPDRPEVDDALAVAGRCVSGGS